MMKRHLNHYYYLTLIGILLYGMFRCVNIAVVHATGEAPVVNSQVGFDKLLIIPILQTKAS